METESSVIFTPPVELPPLRWSHIVQVLLVLNLLDCCFTLMWVCGGEATEANEVMAMLLRLGPVPFALAKMAMVLGGSWVLFLRRHRFLAQVGLVVVTAAYLGVLVHHLRYLFSTWA